MPRISSTDKIEKLRQKQLEIANQLKAVQAREAERRRKEDTRRKVIAGALAVEHMEKNPKSDFAEVMTKLLAEYVRPTDRYLFPSLEQPQVAEQAAE